VYSEGGKLGENGLEKHWEGEEHFLRRGLIKDSEVEIHRRKLKEAKINNNNSGLQKENQELHQQLAEVKAQLAQVLEELKKLKDDTEGKNNDKLSQQISYNERLIKSGEKASVDEVREQVQKSQALMSELNATDSISKDNKGNSSLPYVIGGSVILVSAGVLGYLLVKKSKRK
jgi:hypothetical protein